MFDWSKITNDTSALLLGAIGGGLLSAFITWLALRVYYKQLKIMRIAEIMKTADVIFREWWGPEMNDLRKYFYCDYLKKYYSLHVECDLKNFEHQVKEDNGRLKTLTAFFDRVGWLGAAGLVDVDYVLGPMQHTMRRVWIATEPLIKNTRKMHPPGQLDPVYRLGFEWLFHRSERKCQASLLVHRFSKPKLYSSRNVVKMLKKQIAADEQEFFGYLIELRKQTEKEY